MHKVALLSTAPGWLITKETCYTAGVQRWLAVNQCLNSSGEAYSLSALQLVHQVVLQLHNTVQLQLIAGD